MAPAGNKLYECDNQKRAASLDSYASMEFVALVEENCF